MSGSCWSVRSLAIAAGIFWGLYLFLAAIFVMYGVSFWWFQSSTFELLIPAYFGLSATWIGAFYGLVEGFICGAICGALMAFLYNMANKCCRGKCSNK